MRWLFPFFSWLIASSLITTSPTEARMLTRIQNTSCTKAGTKRIYNHVVLKCAKIGGKLLWQSIINQNQGPIIPKKSVTYTPILLFTSLPNSKTVWDVSMVNKATAASQEAFNWWNQVSENSIRFTPPKIIQPTVSAQAASCTPAKAANDILRRLNLLKLVSTTRIITFSLNALSCPFVGVGENSAKFVMINGKNLSVDISTGEYPYSFSSDVIAHELGHTFGLDHSGSIVCEMDNSNSKYLIDRKCTFDEYGDQSDVMGGNSVTTCPNESLNHSPKISNLNRFLGLGQIFPLPIKQSGVFQINQYSEDRSKSLYSLITDYGVAYIEYKNQDEVACSYFTSGSINTWNFDISSDGNVYQALKLLSKPSIQIRFVGNDQFKPVPRNVSYPFTSTILARKLERSYSTLLADGREQSITWDGNELNFQIGEMIRIPNSEFQLVLTDADGPKGKIKVTLNK